jgi:hypothetical protein
MHVIRFFLVVVSLTIVCNAQTTSGSDSIKTPFNQAFTEVKSSPAYAEVLLNRTELEADLEELLVAYTLEFPKVKEIQFKLGLLKTEMAKLFAVKQTESQKLTLALGKLIVRKVELEGDLWSLQKQYGDEHPTVKKAKRKVLVYQSAIKDVLF